MKRQEYPIFWNWKSYNLNNDKEDGKYYEC